MNRVYITQSPMRRNEHKQLVHMYDLTPAREYGSLEVLLPSGPTLLDSSHATRLLRSKLGDFRPTDYLLCLGDPVAIAAAAAMVAQINGGIIPLLVYDKHTKKYVCSRVDTHAVYHPD